MLQRTLTASLLFAIFLPALLRADDAPKGDKDLDGEWDVVSAVKDGGDLGPPPIKMVMTFKGDAFTFQVGDETYKVRATIDPSKTPKVIDVVHDEGPQKGMAIPGVYEVKEDELHICQADPGKDRPTELSSKKGSGWTFLTLKRVKK